jgi:hypothetical protein
VVAVRIDISEERIASMWLSFVRRLLRLIATVNVDPSSPILVTLMMEAIVLRNVDSFKSHMASHPRRRYSSVLRFMSQFPQIIARYRDKKPSLFEKSGTRSHVSSSYSGIYVQAFMTKVSPKFCLTCSCSMQ